MVKSVLQKIFSKQPRQRLRVKRKKLRKEKRTEREEQNKLRPQKKLTSSPKLSRILRQNLTPTNKILKSLKNHRIGIMLSLLTQINPLQQRISPMLKRIMRIWQN
jgi:hypothetical protein